MHEALRDVIQGGFPVNAELVNTTSITTTKLGKRTSFCGSLTHRTSEGALNGGITNRIVVNGHPREGCLKIGPSYGYSLIIFPKTDLKFSLGSLSNMSFLSSSSCTSSTWTNWDLLSEYSLRMSTASIFPQSRRMQLGTLIPVGYRALRDGRWEGGDMMKHGIP